MSADRLRDNWLQFKDRLTQQWVKFRDEYLVQDERWPQIEGNDAMVLGNGQERNTECDR